MHYQDIWIRESFDGGTLWWLRLEQGIVFRFGNFYLLHTVCILVYLLFVKLCVPQLQVTMKLLPLPSSLSTRMVP